MKKSTFRKGFENNRKSDEKGSSEYVDLGPSLVKNHQKYHPKNHKKNDHQKT